MDRSTKKKSARRANGNGGAAAANKDLTQAANVIAQPPVIPPPKKTKRLQDTKELQCIHDKILSGILNCQCGSPCVKPVDAIESHLFHCHRLVKYPMYFAIIKDRLERSYYYSAQECLRDFRKLFRNCYAYNDPTSEIVAMTEHVEKLYKENIAVIPKEEVEPPLQKDLNKLKKNVNDNQETGVGSPSGSCNEKNPGLEGTSKKVKVIPNREAPAKGDLKQKERPVAVNGEENTKEGQENENTYEYTVELNDLKMVFKRIYPAESDDSGKNERPAKKMRTALSDTKAKNVRPVMKERFGPNKQRLPDRKKVESESEADEKQKQAIQRAKIALQNRRSVGNAKRKSKTGF